ARIARGSAGRVCDRPRRAGVGARGHVRDGGCRGGGGFRAPVRLSPRSDDRTPRASPADLPADDQLRTLRKAVAQLGSVGFIGSRSELLDAKSRKQTLRLYRPSLTPTCTRTMCVSLSNGVITVPVGRSWMLPGRR